MFRVAHSLIVNSDGKALRLKIGEHKRVPSRSNTFDLPGGIVKANESLSEGASRELREETGIILSPDKFNMAYQETKFIRSVTRALFVGLVDKPEVTLSWEHASYAWVTFEEILATDLDSFFKKALLDVKDEDFISELMNR